MNSKLREIWQKRHHPQTMGKTKIYDMSKDRNYQRLLNAKRWAETKLIVRERTNGLCEECLKEGRYVKATVVDHVVPHRGDPTLFWDRSNWRGLCKSCHDKKTGREDSHPTYHY